MEGEIHLRLASLESDLETKFQQILQENGQLSKVPTDIIHLGLYVKEQQIKELRQDIDDYNNLHFTKRYELLQNHCTKLQTDLDGMDLTGRDNERQLKKKVLSQINELANNLALKVHSDGQLCDDCELKHK